MYPEYREEEVDWKYVAAFFDGEGAVTFRVSEGSFTADVALTITSTYRPVIAELAGFLREEDIRVSVVERGTRVYVSKRDSVIKMGRAMLPYLRIKHDQVRALIDYLEDRLTVNEFYEILMKAWRERARRERPELPYPLPYTHSEGHHLAHRLGGLGRTIARGIDQEVMEEYERLKRIVTPKRSDLIV